MSDISNLGMVGSWSIWLGLRVDRGALVGDLRHIAVDVVGSVLHMLDPAVRESHRVRARDNTVGIAGLGSVEVGLGVVVSDTIRIGVGFRGLLDNWVVCRGRVHNRGRMNYGGSVVCRSRGMVYDWSHWAIGRCGMVDSMMSYRVVDSVSHRVVDCMWRRVVDSMGDWMGNKAMVGNCVG